MRRNEKININFLEIIFKTLQEKYDVVIDMLARKTARMLDRTRMAV